MLKNYFLISLRHLLKNKLFSFINIFGLALGIASFMLIISYVRFEHSYDRINEKIDDIYRVESIFYKGDLKTDHWPTSTNGAGKALIESFPEVLDMTRINWRNSDRMVRYKELTFRENHVCFADSNFFTFFDYPVIKGNRETFLRESNTVIISESAARKYFGEEDPMGKRIQISTFSNSFDCEVTGVFSDIPPNHTMQFDFLMSWQTSGRWMWDFWYLHESYTYVKLKEGAVPDDLEAKFPMVAERFKTKETLKDHTWAIDLVPLKDVHLNPAKPYEIEAKGNRRAVNFLLLISFVILIIAWVNYINLSTAKALERAKEVGIRKVSGSFKSQLVLQFLTESALINIIAGVIALVVVFLAVSLLPTVIGASFFTGIFSDPSFTVIFICIVIIGIFLSGIYPAFVLSGFKPSVILKGKYETSKGGTLLRQALVIVQFAITIILIGSTLIVGQQIKHMKNQNLGINIKQTLVIEAPTINENYKAKMNSFKNEVKSISGVEAVTRSGSVPGKEVAKFLANRREYAPVEEQRLYEMQMMDFDYIETYGLELVAGRDFDRNRPTDSIALILNQAAVEQFGFESEEAAINERIILEVTPNKRNHIIGVVKNYHQQSLQKDYTPIILFMDPDYSWIPITYFSIKINTDDFKDVLATIEEKWETFFPESSFDYFFLDDFFNRQYVADKQYGRTFATFSILAIFIACLGLFGLTMFTTANRTKEIGVRKVLGASVKNIVGLLNIELFKLLLVSSLFGIPMAYYLIGKWLDGYAFKTSLTWWMFAIPVVVVLVLSFLTTSYLTVKAATANPTDSLKCE
ncbi:MAG: ABC transporter permease [Cytophagales bacterium]|nr:ABC transporter permease [Cytophagales bacterium]